MQTSVYIPNLDSNISQDIRIGAQFRNMILSGEVNAIEVTAEYNTSTQTLVLSELTERQTQIPYYDRMEFNSPYNKNGWNVGIRLNFINGKSDDVFFAPKSGGILSTTSEPVSLTFTRYKIGDTWYNF